MAAYIVKLTFIKRTTTVEVAQAKTPVCQPVYQTGFHTDEEECDDSRVDSEFRVINSVREGLLLPRPPPLPWLLSPGDAVVSFGNFFLKFHIRLLATR